MALFFTRPTDCRKTHCEKSPIQGINRLSPYEQFIAFKIREKNHPVGTLLINIECFQSVGSLVRICGMFLIAVKVYQGCHGHGKVMDFLEFLEKSWNFD